MNISKHKNNQPIKRKSNIELLGIIGMLMIISHHYVVNSGIMENFPIGCNSYKFLFLSIFGMWGKTGINIFILISGYFMCKSNLTIKRYCKVLFEIVFYNFTIFIIMYFMGYESLTSARLYDLFFGLLKYSNGSGYFTNSFIIFYLFIPFINIFIKSLTKNEYKNFVLLIIFVFTFLSTFFFNINIFGEVFWFIAIYFIAGYIRLYSPSWSKNIKASSILLITSIILCVLSVLFIIYTKLAVHQYFFVSDANKLGALLVSIFMFTTFKNVHIDYSKVINTIAKTTFGILLIHANSDAWRTFMWKDLLHVNTSWTLPFKILVLRSIIIVILIFIICSIIDLVRIFTVEKIVFNHFDAIKKYILCISNSIKNKIKKLYFRIINVIS